MNFLQPERKKLDGDYNHVQRQSLPENEEIPEIKDKFLIFLSIDFFDWTECNADILPSSCPRTSDC